MTLEELNFLEKKKSNVAEFLNFLYDQNLPPEFKSFSTIFINSDLLDDLVELYQVEKENLYFVLTYNSKEVIVFKLNHACDKVDRVFLIDELNFKKIMSYLSTLLNFDNVKKYERNSRLE